MNSLLAVLAALAVVTLAQDLGPVPDEVEPKCTCVRDCLDVDFAMECLRFCLNSTAACANVNHSEIWEFVKYGYEEVPEPGELEGLDPENATVLQRAVIAYAGYAAARFAVSKLGKPYTHNHNVAFGPTYYDCTGLVYSAWKKAGKTVPSSAPACIT